MTTGECIYRKTETIRPGWLLIKTILEGFSDLGISCYRKLGRGARCIKLKMGLYLLN